MGYSRPPGRIKTANDDQTYHITGMDVLIEGLLDQVLWLEASEGGHPLVEEDQLQIQRCSEDLLRYESSPLILIRS